MSKSVCNHPHGTCKVCWERQRELSEEVDRLRTALAESREAVGIARNAHDGVQKVLISTQAALTESRREVELLRGERDALLKQGHNQRAENADLRRQVEDLSEENRLVSEQRDSMAKQVEEQAGKLAEARGALASAEDCLIGHAPRCNDCGRALLAVRHALSTPPESEARPKCCPLRIIGNERHSSTCPEGQTVSADTCLCFTDPRQHPFSACGVPCPEHYAAWEKLKAEGQTVRRSMSERYNLPHPTEHQVNEAIAECEESCPCQPSLLHLGMEVERLRAQLATRPSPSEEALRLKEALKRALVRFAAISTMSAPIRPSGHSELCGLVDELESQGLMGMGEVEAALSSSAFGRAAHAAGREEEHRKVKRLLEIIDEQTRIIKGLFLPQPTPEPAEPLPLVLYCPAGHKHVDEGEWATRLHKTHQCQEQVMKGDYTETGGVRVYGSCGLEWRPADFPTVGVASLSKHDWECAEHRTFGPSHIPCAGCLVES